VAEHLDYDAHAAARHSPHAIKGSVMDRVDIITGTLSLVVSKKRIFLNVLQAP
jgi:hypothetical protein